MKKRIILPLLLIILIPVGTVQATDLNAIPVAASNFDGDAGVIDLVNSDNQTYSDDSANSADNYTRGEDFTTTGGSGTINSVVAHVQHYETDEGLTGMTLQYCQSLSLDCTDSANWTSLTAVSVTASEVDDSYTIPSADANTWSKVQNLWVILEYDEAGGKPSKIFVDFIYLTVNYNRVPDVNMNAPIGGETVSGVYAIDFNVSDDDNDELHIRIAYSTSGEGAGAFGTDINADVNLNNYAVDNNLSCDDSDWTNSTNCTYNWGTTGAADGDYFIDLNLWDPNNLNDINSSNSTFTIDNIPATTSIDVGNSPMNFALDPGVPDENGSSNTPFLITNTGGVNIDVSIDASLINWSGTTGGTDRNYYRWIADNDETGSCTTFGVSAWTAMYITDIVGTNQDLCQGFSNAGASNQINVGIKVMAPDDEPDTSTPSSTVTFYIAEDTTGANDALVTYP